MKLRETHTPAIAGAKAGFSTATAYLLDKELHLRPVSKPPRERRRPDPLLSIWDSEIVPMLSSDIRNPSGADTENPATSAIVTPRQMPVRVLP